MRLRSIPSHVRIKHGLQRPFYLGKYTYEPLPSPTSIRLLELVPSGHSVILRCSLKTFDLHHAPPFKALSYTWGKATATLKESHSVSQPRDHSDGTSEIIAESSAGSRRHSIICDGRLIKVTSSLRDALRMLANAIKLPQMPKIPSYYWIDALCVNQGDIEERNAQVARMADIFTRADGVVVWLGKEDKFTNDALMTIRRISAIPEKEWSSVPYTSFYNPEENHLGYSSTLTFHNWLGFMVLINRPWFRRAWVVQEIALGKSALVVCGRKVFTWEALSKTLSFIKATKWYHHLRTEKMKHVRTLQKHPGIYKRVLQLKLSVGIGPIYLNETRLARSASVESDGQSTAQLPPLRMLIDKHRFSKSSDPRDKVYAFLGLADRALSPFRTHPTALTPNYNLSVQEVYTEIARVFMASYRNLSWLSHVEDPSLKSIPGLPSWVPDLSVSLDPYPLRYRGPGFWKASGSKDWNPDMNSMAHGELNVQGYLLDHIQEVSVLLNESEDSSATWASIVTLALSLDFPYPNPGQNGKNPSRVEVLWRTLTTDIYAHTYPAPVEAGSLFIDYILNLQIRHRLTPWSSADEFQPHQSPLSDSIYPEWRTLLKLEPPDSPYCLDRYIERLTTVVESMFSGTYSPIGLAQLQHELDQSGGNKRRLFKTCRGFMGTGPRSLRVGDEVWILHRGGLPFVLRPLPNGNYRLIGESFVYGVMHGEALSMNLPRQSITIK